MSSTGPLSELDSLRLQVAELSRTLAERDQVLQDWPQQANLLRAIVEGTSADIGVEFFRSLVKQLAQALNVRYAFVGEWREQTPGKVSTLAVWSGTDFAEPFDYDLKGSPCEHVIGQQLYLHESGIQERFSDNHLLAQLEVQSYCGIPLVDQSRTALGLLVVMDDRPFTNAPLIKDLLQVFATRAAGELQRQRAEMTLQEQERRLRFTQFSLDHAADAVLWADDATQFIYANEAACRSLGYSNEELLTLSIPDIAPHHDPIQFHKRLDQAKQGTAVMYESVHRRKDGTEFPIEVSVTYLEHDGRGYTCGIIRNITERKYLEQERLQALHDLKNIMETVPDFMFTLDCQGNMVKWNRRVEEVTGYSPEELLNMPALAFVPPEAAARTAAAIQQAFTEGYAQLDGSLLTKDHRLIPYHWTGALLKNPDGEPIGITGIGRDVTERNRLEAALQQERQHLVEAQALAHLGSWDWDIDSGDVRSSDEQFRIFGHEPGPFAVKFDLFFAALHPDDHDHVLTAINDALLGTRPYDIEYRIVRPNGEVRSIHARGDVHRDEIGHPISMAGTVLDITERMQIEEALRTSEERWQLAVQGSNDGIWDWNIPTGEVFFSTRWKVMRGFEDHEISNHLDEWRSRIHPDDLDRVLQHIDTYLAKQASEFCEEYRVQRKDGSYMWILDRGAALWDDDGTPLRMAGSETDITKRKQAEGKLGLTKFTIDHATDAVYWIGPEAQITEVNEAASLMLEYSKGELCAMTVHDLNPHFQSDMWPGFWAETRQRRSMTFETVHRSKTGQFIPVEVNVNYLSYEGQELHCAFVRNITDRKKIQEELRRSKSQLTHILENNPAVVYARQVGEGWPMTFVTPNIYKLLGYTSVDLLSDPNRFDSLIHQDDERDVITRGMPQLLRDGACTFVYRIRHRDGTHRWIENLAKLSDNGQGGLQIVGTMTDITDRKKAEEALEEERHRLVMAQLLAHLGSWEWNILTGIKTWSDESYRIFGYDPGSIQPTYEIFAQAIHPQDRERVVQAARATLEDDRASCDLECRIVRPSGEVRHIHCRGEVTRNDAGRPLQMAGTVLDITERKHTQEALAQRESQLQTVLDALPLGVWFTDLSGKPLLANPAARQIWSGIKQIGIETAAHAAGWWEAVGSSSGPHRWALGQALTKGVPSLRETLDFECLDGTNKTIRNTAVPVRNEAGIVFGAIVLNEDITALRRAQETIKLTQFSIDHAVEGFFWIGPDAKILHVNEAACRMLEYASAELTAMTVHDIDPNFPREQWSAHWEELKRKGSLTFESKHWSRTGRVLDTEVTVNYLQYDGREYNCAIMRDIGERKRADEALRTSEERYRALYDETPTMYFTLATDGTVCSVNRFGAEQLGYQAEELIGHSVLRIFHEDDKEAVSTSLSECLATPETTKHWEFRKVRKNGQIIWVRETARVGQSSAGETVLLVTCEDITAQKLAEAQQARQDDQLQAIFRMTLTLSHATSLDDIYGEAIDCMRRALKADRASIRLFDEAGAMRFKASRGLSERYQSAVEGYSLWTSKTVDPQTILIDDISSDPSVAQYREVFDAEGIKALAFIPLVLPERLLGKFMLYYDIPHHFTEEEVGVAKTIAGHVAYMIQRTRADQALRVSEERYRSLVDNAPIGIFVNEAGRFTYVNREMQRILRAAHTDQLIGMPVLDRIAPEFHQIAQARTYQLMENRQPAPSLDEQYVGLDGSRVDVAVTAIPTTFDGATVMQVLVLDITERKQLAERETSRLKQLKKLSELSMTLSGDPFMVFDQIIRIIGELFNVRVVCLSEIVEGELHFKSVYINGQILRDAGHCPINITPCATVAQSKDMRIFDHVMERFPHASFLKDHQAFSYCGFPALDNQGAVVAVTCLLDDKPHEFTEEEQEILRIIGQRIAVEVERSRYINQQQEAENALRQSHTLLSAIMDATTDIVFVKDLQGRYLHMNPAGARAVGMSVEEVVGKDDDAIWPADLAACCQEADRKILASGVAQTMEESTTVDGQRITYLTTKTPYRDAAGRLIGIIGVAHDISQMKRSEEELRRSHAFLRQVIDINPNFVFAKDRVGRFALVNKAVADAYGTTVENLIGKTDADFNADQKAVAFFRETDLEVMNSLQDLFLPEEAITDSTGKMRWLQTVKRPLFNEQGQAIMVLGAATDITERKRMEEALRQRERDLRVAIEERERISQDLHDGILQSLFAVGLSLETTKSMMSLKERKTSGPALKQAIDQLNRLMHEVRNFIAGLGSDLLQGKDLPTALHNMLKTLTKNHPTRVRLKVEDRAAQALSAEQSLHLLLVIQEAVSNCIRHGHAQEATVSLKLLKQGVRLSVRDNGCGFDSAASKGIGHGLANMAARAQKIGGRFTVLSKTNEGTRVVLDLPKEVALAHS